MSESGPIALEVSNLTKGFGNLTAVNHISFKIHEGDIVGILGPNGAGKTTTIRLITGIFKLRNGSRVNIYSRDFTSNQKELKKQFGIVPEISNAYTDYTVWQNLNFSGTVYGLSKDEIKKRVNSLLDRFELTDKIDEKIKTLSKGLKQRLNLCLALLHEPPILILDEPTSGLDPISISIVRNQILDLKKEGKTILITTHNMQEAQQICDRILIMNNGKIIADEDPDNLRKNFKESATLTFNFQGDVSNELKQELKTVFTRVKEKKSKVHITTNKPLEDISRLNDLLKKNNISIQNFKLKETSLEEVFIHLIKKDLNKNQRGIEV